MMPSAARAIQLPVIWRVAISAAMSFPTRTLVALPALAAALLLAGCGGAETKLRNGLISAGLSESYASCMAKPMAKKLSVNQLMKLNSLAKTSRLDPRRTTYDEYLRHVRALGDAEILQVTASAALGCAFEI